MSFIIGYDSFKRKIKIKTTMKPTNTAQILRIELRIKSF